MKKSLHVALNIALIIVASIAVFFLVLAVRPAPAQVPQVAPGWFITGEWQCGPHVRIISSSDGLGGADFYVKGAWFDNHYTIRRRQLYYNGMPCVPLGDPWAFMTYPRPKRIVKERGCRLDGTDLDSGLPICE